MKNGKKKNGKDKPLKLTLIFLLSQTLIFEVDF